MSRDPRFWILLAWTTALAVAVYFALLAVLDASEGAPAGREPTSEPAPPPVPPHDH